MKGNVLVAVICLGPQVKPTLLGPNSEVSTYLRSGFYLRMETESSPKRSFYKN
jgi:hypothetical protein